MFLVSDVERERTGNEDGEDLIEAFSDPGTLEKAGS
jgi:hypothetical protein